MARKFLLCFVTILVTLGMVLTGCGTTGLGEQVEIKLIIRTEDERMDMGDYFGNLLEDLGFAVDRMYKTSGEAAPIWLGDPDLGLWHGYTGGWVSTVVSRDDGSNFGAFYTPLWSAMGPLWQAYDPTLEFQDVCNALWYNDFNTMEEREALFEDVLWMSMEDSARVFLVDRTGFSPLRSDVHLAADKAGGIYGSWIWAHSAHFRDESGVPLKPTGSTLLRVATADLLIDPWNPVAGTNWAYDMFPIRATGDMGVEPDTTTGLRWPHRIESAEVTVLEGLPIAVNEGHESWLTLSTTSERIPVPATAWADWDASAGEWITAGEGVTAKVKVVVHFPADTIGLPLHDGSTLDEGDFLFYAIQQFDRAKEASDIYDPGYVTEYNAFMSHFKGVEYNFGVDGSITITSYEDEWYMDPEVIVYENTWFPAADYGPFVWPNLALGYMAEKDNKVAFSNYKATANEVEWLSLISGPSLGILEGYLDEALSSAFIPYSNVLGEYITEAEAVARYTNLQNWYDAMGHFWTASGPFYLKSVDTTADIVELARFADYPDNGNRWFFLLDPAPVTPPAHTGAWVDTIVITVEQDAAAITKLVNDELDVYAFAIVDTDLFETVDADPDVWYYRSIGSFNEFTLNPSGPLFTGTAKLNPFAIPEIREAINWLIDRDYIVGEIMGGLGYPRYTALDSQGGDAIRYAGVLAEVEAYYAHDFDQADAAIEAAMLEIAGVSRADDGRYWYSP